MPPPFPHIECPLKVKVIITNYTTPVKGVLRTAGVLPGRCARRYSWRVLPMAQAKGWVLPCLCPRREQRWRAAPVGLKGMGRGARMGKSSWQEGAMAGILEGIRVLDWSWWHQGAAVSYILGDMGAQVIKIEDPVQGDAMRGTRRFMGI